MVEGDEIAGFVSMRDLFEVLVEVAAHEEDVVVVPSGTRVVVRQDERARAHSPATTSVPCLIARLASSSAATSAPPMRCASRPRPS